MDNQWTEIAHYVVPLYAFMGQVRLGQRHGLFVYYVQLNECLYVGQTYNGVRLRLWRHVRQRTPLGEWICTNEFVDPEPSCGVIAVSNNLDMAERYYISLFGPTLNIVQYKTSTIISPITRSSISELAIARPMGLEFGAMTGRRKDGVWAGENISMPHTERSDLDGLYEKAYRDPNHPDLRTP
jgi:hypothetical protein